MGAAYRHILLQSLRAWLARFKTFHEINDRLKRRALATLCKVSKLRQKLRAHVRQTRLLHQQRCWSRVVDAIGRSHNRRRGVVEKFSAMIRSSLKFVLVADQVMPRRYSHVFFQGGSRTAQTGHGHHNILSRLHIEETRLSHVRRVDSLYADENISSSSASIENIYKLIRQNKLNESFRRNMTYAQQLVLSLYISSSMHRRSAPLKVLHAWCGWAKLHRNNKVIVDACNSRKQLRVIEWLHHYSRWRKLIRVIKRRRSASALLKWKMAYVATRERRRKRRQIMKFMRIRFRIQSSCRYWLRSYSNMIETA